MKKAILFDLDGTLADTLTDLALTTNRVLEAFGLPPHPIDAYRQFVGNGARKLVASAANTTDDALIDRLFSRFLTEYDQHLLDHTQPYDGVVDTLDALLANGVRLAVVTNKPHEQALRLTAHLFGDRFEVIFGGSGDYPKKPDPQSTQLAMEALRVSTRDCVFVGDSDVDVYTAHNAGMPCIGCAFGFRGETELEEAGADALVYSFTEILKNRLIFE